MSEGPASSTAGCGDWFRPGRFAIMLAVMVFVPFWDVLLGLRTFAVRDFGLFSYPVANYFRESFWRGQWPLWNPLSCLGTPFLAQLNTLTLYPPSLIYLLLPLTWALPFFCLLHLYLGGLGMYFLAARWSGSRLGGAVAGTVFAFNGLSLNFLMWPSHIATFALLPWVILLTQQAWEGGGRKIILAALLAALQVLAGGPETILLTWLVLLALAVAAMSSRPLARIFGCMVGRCSTAAPILGLGEFPHPRNQGGGGAPPYRGSFVGPATLARRFLAVGILALALAAAQLLPFADLSLHSNRSNQFGNGAWAMPAGGWANFIEPLFQTSHWQQIIVQQHQYWTSSYYVGIGTIFLAVMALLRRRTGRIWTLGGATVICMVLALGDNGFLFGPLQGLLPFLGLFRYPVKFVLATTAAFPLLAAAAVGFYDDEGRRRREESLISPSGGACHCKSFGLPDAICGASLLLLLGFIIWFARRWPEGNLAWAEMALNGGERAAFLLMTMGGIYLLTARPQWRAWTGSALIAIFWLDVLTHEPWQNPTIDPSIYQPDLAVRHADFKPGPVLAGQSRLMQSPYSARQTYFNSLGDVTTNYLLDRAVFEANCNLIDGVPKVDGFFSLYLRDTDKVLSLFDTNSEVRLKPLVDLMAVSQTIAPGKVFDWVARPGYIPWVTAGQSPVFADEKTTLRALTDPASDFRKTIYLPSEARTIVTAQRQETARVTTQIFTPQKILLTVESPGPALVSLSQAWYHNWKATVDGAATPVWRANQAFQAVESPAGRHEVILYYEDTGFRCGGWISMVALLISALGWWHLGKPLKMQEPT